MISVSEAGGPKEKVIEHATLIGGSILYLNHETDLNFVIHHFMFEKSGAHILLTSLTRFSEVDLYLADKVNHEYGRSTAYLQYE